MRRREFLEIAAATAVGVVCVGPAAAEPKQWPALTGEIGITTGSFVRHLSETPQAGKLRLLDLPRIMREEMDMRVLDLMTATLVSMEPAYLEQLRTAAEKVGCVLTNLKMNLRDLDLGSEDEGMRRHAIDEFKGTIDAAALLGVRWVRPLPGNKRPVMATLAKSYRELIDHAAPRNISLLVENFGWLSSDPEAVPELIKAIGSGVAAQPDTGNWANNEVRYAGLARAFPLAASCDFKFMEFNPTTGAERVNNHLCSGLAVETQESGLSNAELSGDKVSQVGVALDEGGFAGFERGFVGAVFDFDANGTKVADVGER